MFANIIFGFMGLLALWSVTNIAMWHKNRNTVGQQKYYWQMNALWNCVNLSIVVIACLLVLLNLNSYNTSQGLQELQIWIVSVNILFDLVYVGIGAWLENKGKKQNNVRFSGYGVSIQLQGAFLFFFDTILSLSLLIAII